MAYHFCLCTLSQGHKYGPGANWAYLHIGTRIFLCRISCQRQRFGLQLSQHQHKGDVMTWRYPCLRPGLHAFLSLLVVADGGVHGRYTVRRHSGAPLAARQAAKGSYSKSRRVIITVHSTRIYHG